MRRPSLLQQGALLLATTATTSRLVVAGLHGLRAVAHHRCQGLVEDILEAITGQGGALEVLQGIDLLRLLGALLGVDGLLALLLQLLKGLLIGAKIDLGTDEDNGNLGAVVLELEISLELRDQAKGEGARTSGHHLSLTLTNDGWLTTEKQTRKMSVLGYERVRMRA